MSRCSPGPDDVLVSFLLLTVLLLFGGGGGDGTTIATAASVTSGSTPDPPAAASTSSPSCNPMICLCSPDRTFANCSSKGFLIMPTGLPSALTHLTFAHNDLDQLNNTELARLADLSSLDLSHNQLTSADLGVHYKLERLDLSSNRISSVRSLQLQGLIMLQELDLSGNRIISLPPRTFAGSAMLRSLNLRSNRIVSLEPGCLDQLVALETLVLTRNRLSSFPKGLFQKMKSLKTLELNKNKFVEIQGLSFHGLENLKTLKLKRNQIQYLSDGAFFGLQSIEDLQLDRNRVTSVDKGWLYGLYTLRQLSLAHNQVDYIAEDSWEFCHVLNQLDLRNNELQVLSRYSLRMLPQLRTLNLQDNLISHIEDDDTFAEVPLLEVLSLDGNQLSHTVEDTHAPFRGLLRLHRLSLARNLIKSVGKQAFAGLRDLEQVDLNGNVISTVQENAFAHLKPLQSVQMDSGSMLCDCHLKWLPRWLNETLVEGVQGTCAHPEILKGRLITTISYDSYTCEDYPKPYILAHPETKVMLKGNHVKLKCRAASTSPDEMNFQWKLDSEVIELGDECDGEDEDADAGVDAGVVADAGVDPAGVVLDNINKYRRCVYNTVHSSDGKGQSVTSELRLYNLTYDDAGQYQCVVDNKYGATYSDKANITVFVYPQFIVTPEDITVEGGSTAALQCAARGVPAPTMSWSKDSGTDFPAASERRILVKSSPAGDDPSTNVNSFVIYSVKAKDMGVYQCTASNPAGSITWNISLSVLELPRFVEPMESKSVDSGDTAVIECLASGSPKPRLTWTKDGGKLETTERHFFTADNQKLIIVKAREDDAGRYECTILNSLGKESQSSQLTVLPAGPLGIAPFGSGSGSDSSLLNGSGESTLTIVIVAVVICFVLICLVWVTTHVVYKRRNAASATTTRHHQAPPGYAPPGVHRDPHGAVGASRDFLHRRHSVMDINSLPGEGEFDIHEHVRKGLMAEHAAQHNSSLGTTIELNTTDSGAVGIGGGDSRRLGVAEDDFDQGHDGDDDESLERDSGTGDSKKSNDRNDEDEGEDLGLGESDVLLAPRETDSLILQTSHQEGGGEGRLSLSEFEALNSKGGASGIKFADADDNSSSDSSLQGGGEGLLSADDDSSLTSRSTSQKPPPRPPKSLVASRKPAPAPPPLPSETQDDPAEPPAVTFRTFYPHGRRTFGSVNQLAMARELQPSPSSSFSSNSAVNNNSKHSGSKAKNTRKRASAVELNGECYLAIEPEPPRTPADASKVEPCVYRGGVGSLPRHGLAFQQELLEASLNSSDVHNSSRGSGGPGSATADRKPRARSGSRSSLFRKKSRQRGSSLPRSRSGNGGLAGSKYKLNGDVGHGHLNDGGFTDVALKGKEMF